jgi:hypothetical protein
MPNKKHVAVPDPTEIRNLILLRRAEVRELKKLLQLSQSVCRLGQFRPVASAAQIGGANG